MRPPPRRSRRVSQNRCIRRSVHPKRPFFCFKLNNHNGTNVYIIFGDVAAAIFRKVKANQILQEKQYSTERSATMYFRKNQHANSSSVKTIIPHCMYYHPKTNHIPLTWWRSHLYATKSTVWPTPHWRTLATLPTDPEERYGTLRGHPKRRSRWGSPTSTSKTQMRQ